MLRVLRLTSLLCLFVLVAIFASACQPIQPETASPTAPLANTVNPSDPIEVQIANAMSAAPSALAKEATLIGFPTEEGGEMVVLREGSNGWTCLTDWPASPGNDPSCNDPVWTAWNDALATGSDPEVASLGLAYMLQGGSDPSNTDPAAMEPAPGDEWVNSLPHVMLIRPEGFDPNVFSTDPTSPIFIMWAGTPFQHLHIGIPAQPEAIQESDEMIKNAMSAAPIAIAQDATVIGYPVEAGGDMVVLREGTNTWSCYPDWPATPGNDPMCLDPVWQGWFMAYVTGAEPEISTPGITYMLAGGSEASNTDPSAFEPAAGEEWITSPPHIMLLVPGGFDAADFTTDHTSGYPYIMWDGTPYEHLMVPVQIGIQSVVIDGAGPITASDPTQAQAEAEFRAVAIAKDQAFYDGDVERHLFYYADDVISVQPGMPEIVGKAALADGMKPYMEGYRIVGTETIKRFWVDGDHATRFAEWEEVVTPNDGGASEYHIGRCILNWEKIDGEWKVVSEFVNYLVPPTEMD